MALSEHGDPATVVASTEGRFDWLRPRLRVLIALLGVTLALSFLGPWWWWADLLAEFRLQFLILAALLAVWAGLLRAWPELALAAGVAALDLLGSRPAGPAPTAQVADGAATIRLVHFNALKGSAADEAFLDWIAEVEPDLVFVQEVDAARVEALTGAPGFRTLAADYRQDNFGLVVLARESVADELEVNVLHFGGLPSLEVRLTHDEQQLAILSTHTLPPVGATMAAARNRHLAAAGAWAEDMRDDGALPVIIGDLNATPWSHAFRTVVSEHELVDSRRGFGIHATWPAPLGGAGIPIDHCLHDPGLVTVHREVGPHLGSDHRPVVVELVGGTKRLKGDGKGPP